MEYMRTDCRDSSDHGGNQHHTPSLLLYMYNSSFVLHEVYHHLFCIDGLLFCVHIEFGDQVCIQFHFQQQDRINLSHLILHQCYQFPCTMVRVGWKSQLFKLSLYQFDCDLILKISMIYH